MTEQPITYQVVAESLFKDLLENIVRQQTLVNMANQRSMQKAVGISEHSKSTVNMNGFSNTEVGSNRDIFGQEKLKLKATEAARYFPCENCGRKIAGGRFAQHVGKCLERKRR